MNSKELFLIERLDQLIRLKATGSPTDLAAKLNISERHVYNIINKIKEVYRAPLEFDKNINSYTYTEKGKILIGFQKDIIPQNGLKKILGGKNYSLKFYFSECV